MARITVPVAKEMNLAIVVAAVNLFANVGSGYSRAERRFSPSSGSRVVRTICLNCLVDQFRESSRCSQSYQGLHERRI